MTKEPSGICRSCDNDKRGLFFYNRSLKADPPGNGADGAETREFLRVTLSCVHIEDRRKAAAVFRLYAALIELYILQNVGVEGGEKTKKMRGVIHYGIVKQDQVLVR